MPAKTKHRLIIDTNLWLSFLLTGDHSKLDPLLAGESITLLFSQQLIDEFIEVAQRPKFRKYFSLDDLEDILTRVRTTAEFISVIATANLCIGTRRQGDAFTNRR